MLLSGHSVGRFRHLLVVSWFVGCDDGLVACMVLRFMQLTFSRFVIFWIGYGGFVLGFLDC